MANGKETAVITTAPRVLPLDIQTSDDAWRHAQRIASSGLVPEALRGKPNDVMIVLMWGKRLGLVPEQAIQDIHVIKGKPVIAADALVAQCVQHRDVCAYLVPTVSTSERAEYQTQRVGAPVATTMAYTLEDAKRAGLTNKDTWKSHPAAMLRARCASALARAVYPDLVRGFYLHDEIEDVPGTATLVQAPKTLADLTAGMTVKLPIKPVLLEYATENLGSPTPTLAGKVPTIDVGAITPAEAEDIAAQEREVGSDG